MGFRSSPPDIEPGTSLSRSKPRRLLVRQRQAFVAWIVGAAEPPASFRPGGTQRRADLTAESYIRPVAIGRHRPTLPAQYHHLGQPSIHA